MGSRSIQTFVVHMIAEFTCLAVLYGSQVFTKVSNAKSSISILHIAMTTRLKFKIISKPTYIV